MFFNFVRYVFFFLRVRRPPRSTRADSLFHYTTHFRVCGANPPSVLSAPAGFSVSSHVSCRAEPRPAAPTIAACIEGLRARLGIEGDDVEPPLRLVALAGRKVQHEGATEVVADRRPLKARLFGLQQA